MQSKSKFTARELSLLALLSVLWAALEIKLGLFFQTLAIPFFGTILTFLAILILFLGRNSVPKRGTAILMGITTAFLKLIYLGGFSIYPIVAIITQVILIEIGLGKDRPERAQYLLAGALGVTWTFFYPFFALGILAGWGILGVYVMIISWGTKLLGIPEQYALLIFSLLILLHIGLGILAGFLGWKLSHIIHQRVNGYITVVNDFPAVTEN